MAGKMYLVRGPDGTMSTVIAHSLRGAVKLWIVGKHFETGDFVSVKERGQGDDWTDYKISRR